MNGRNAYLVAFGISVAIICYQDMHTCHRLPWPPRLIATGLFFILVSLFSLISEELAGVIAIGTVIAILVNKGFVGTCPPCGTSQPPDATFLQSPTPSNQSPSGAANPVFAPTIPGNPASSPWNPALS